MLDKKKEMKYVMVRSKQPDIKVQHMRPAFKYEFKTYPIEIREDHARFLVNSNPNFEIVRDDLKYIEAKRKELKKEDFLKLMEKEFNIKAKSEKEAIELYKKTNIKDTKESD